MRNALVLILLIGALVPLASAAEDEPATIRVCTSDKNPPFFYQENGEFAGFEHDILSSFSEHLGVELEISTDPIPYGDIQRVFELCDVAAYTLTRTPEREQQLDFSDPYFLVIVVLVEPLGQYSKSLQELSGKRVATLEMSQSRTILEANPEIELVFADSADELLRLVADGKADATAWDSWKIALQLQDYPQLRITAALSDTQYLAFSLAKGSPLTAKLDAHMQQLKESGAFESLLKKHFGEENAELITKALIDQ
jgi:polar amino acid transport system substrate-binding protein